ncbi:TPA: conjugal transfer protein TraN [Escherichia coli]|nr:conjugal transfer protein TraN [Escherichia coli]
MKRVIVMMLAALTIFGTGLQASDKYGSGKQFADSLKGSGSGVLNNFNPGEVIPGYTENPPESAHYGGVTSSNSASLESAGASALNNSEVGKLTSEVIMNRPKDPISMDAPFISGGFDVQDKADIVTNGTYDKCETVNVSKTEITSHVCERTPAAELTCTRKASIKDNVVRKTVRKTYQKVVMLGYNARNVKWSGAFNIPEKGRLLHVAVDGERLVVPWSSKCDRESVTYECKASVKETLSIMGKELPIDILMYPREDSICSGGVNTHCTYHTRNGWGQIHQAFDTDMQVSAGQSFPVVKTSKTFNWYSNQESVQVTITLTLDVEVTEHKPSVEWVETCPFNKAEEVLQGSQCTEAGGNRTINIDGKTYTVYSDCWAWKDTYLKQEADNGSCDVYMKDPACTVTGTMLALYLPFSTASYGWQGLVMLLAAVSVWQVPEQYQGRLFLLWLCSVVWLNGANGAVPVLAGMGMTLMVLCLVHEYVPASSKRLQISRWFAEGYVLHLLIIAVIVYGLQT